MTSGHDSETELRARVVRRLRKQADFRSHLLIYLAVNAFLIVIWATTGAGFFWPIFPLFGWGIGVAVNAWDAYRADPVTEERIRREIDKLRH